MILAKKIRLHPSQLQEQKLWQSVGTARFIYNWTIARQEELIDISLGIDLGISELAICSDGERYKNINKTKVVKKLEKKLRRLQREVSKKYLINKEGGAFVKTSNIIKLEKKIQLLHRTLANSRKNYLHQVTTKIVKTKPFRVVIEDLNAGINLSKYKLA